MNYQKCPAHDSSVDLLLYFNVLGRVAHFIAYILRTWVVCDIRSIPKMKHGEKIDLMSNRNVAHLLTFTFRLSRQESPKISAREPVRWQSDGIYSQQACRFYEINPLVLAGCYAQTQSSRFALNAPVWFQRLLSAPLAAACPLVCNVIVVGQTLWRVNLLLLDSTFCVGGGESKQIFV